MYPAELKYNHEHTWLKLEGDSLGRVGITQFAQEHYFAHLTDMDRREIISLAPLVFLMILFGLYPGPILNLINNTVMNLLGKL